MLVAIVFAVIIIVVVIVVIRVIVVDVVGVRSCRHASRRETFVQRVGECTKTNRRAVDP